jgi:serine/threonine protein kinase
VRLSGGHEFHLGALISAGGEGSIYETPLAGQVCKIYHRNRLTSLKKRKIELMVSRRIDRPGICWPTEVVTDRTGEFVGYLMPRAAGTTIQKAMFVKPVLEKTFPNWRRRDLVNVAGTFVDHISYLHSLNIIVGDINPLNLLVTEDSTRLWMVDTDSFQIENFPCPVGTINFTPPEIQGRNYAEFLRTKDHELFAVATMIFMILFPGKPPYSQQGGGTPADNIKSRNFPYRFSTRPDNDNPEISGKSAPRGSWQFIWSNTPRRIRQAFFSTFHEDKRTSVEEWVDLLIDYRERLNLGQFTNDLFPDNFRILDPIQVSCARCSVSFVASNAWVEKMRLEGKQLWCPSCANRFRLERLAAKSREAAFEIPEPASGYGRGMAVGAQTKQRNPQGSTWQQVASGGGPSRSYRSSTPRSSSQSGRGLLSSILRLIFK